MLRWFATRAFVKGYPRARAAAFIFFETARDRMPAAATPPTLTKPTTQSLASGLPAVQASSRTHSVTHASAGDFSPLEVKMPHQRKLRILATHSFRTSGAIFKEQMQRSGLEKALEDLLDVTYIDAPNAASGPIPDDVSPFFSGPYYEWWNAHRDDRGAWTYEGWQRAVARIEEALQQQGPFDGIMGFSQGGAMASLATGMQRSGFAFKDAPPLRFCICFAGIRVRDPQLECFYEAMRTVPSIHIIGDKDPVKRLTNQLIESFNNPVVINHTRGHVIPALPAPDLQRLRAFLEAQLQEANL